MIRSHQKWDYRYRDHPSLFLMLFPGFIFVCLHSSVCSGTWFVLNIVKRDMWRTGNCYCYRIGYIRNLRLVMRCQELVLMDQIRHQQKFKNCYFKVTGTYYIILSFLYPSFVTTRLPRKLKTEGGSVPVPSMMIRKKKNSGAGADYFSFRS